MSKETDRIEILETAMSLTAEDRNKQYGDPIQNHDNVAAFMRAYLQARRSTDTPYDVFVIESLDAEDAMALMLCMKLARIAQRLGDQYDSYVDACAYAAMMGEAHIQRTGGSKS